MKPVSNESTDARVTPQPILDAAWGFAVTRVLTTAIELDVFTAIARGRTTLEDLAKETSSSPRGLSMLLNALIALKYLDVRAGRHSLSPVSAAFLTKTSPHYIGGYVLHNTGDSWSPWAQLSEVVRRGTPARQSVHGDQADGEFFSQLVQSLHTLSADAAAVAASALGKGMPDKARKVLDVAAGSAVWSLALARENDQTLVTVVDLPGVVDRVTRRFVEQEGFSDRFTFRPGDLRQMDFGESCFDVVILGHICHGEGAEGTQDLIHRAHRALRSGGQILIAEMLPDDDRREPLLPLLFAIQMLVLTDNGNAFTLAEYQSWLLNAGFSDVRTVPAPAPSPLILATRP
ncbi:MAG: methyltransferase domain-containing protein [Acidobacteriia bacterium]|nr:methyltransferase domain-containing protein [Terriglobia bacterium]